MKQLPVFINRKKAPLSNRAVRLKADSQSLDGEVAPQQVFTQDQADQFFYTKSQNGKQTYLLTSVDDMIIYYRRDQDNNYNVHL